MQSRYRIALLWIVAITGAACDDDKDDDAGSDPNIGVICADCEAYDGDTTIPDAAEGHVDAAAGALPVVVATVGWLQDRLRDPDVQVIDARASGFEVARIPGALPLAGAALVDAGNAIPGQVATLEQARTTLRAIGLRADTVAIVYGEPPEYQASRVVWALRHFGHDARYLDGGFTGWSDAGGAVDDDAPPVLEPSDYEPTDGTQLRVTGAWVLEQLGEPPHDSGAIQLVDARSAAEFSDGHIPTALQRNWVDNFADGLLLPSEQLGPMYETLDYDRTTVAYCRTGQRGSAAWLVLSELGFSDVRLYDGSWVEWGAGDFPAEPPIP